MPGESSGTHAARVRIGRAQDAPGFRAPTKGGQETIDMGRPSEPPPSWRTIKALIPTLTLLLGSAATAGTLYATYTSRIDAVQSQMTETTQTLARVEAASRARDEALSTRLSVVERSAAVQETEQRATTRALEQLTEEIRELRAAVQRRR